MTRPGDGTPPAGHRLLSRPAPTEQTASGRDGADRRGSGPAAGQPLTPERLTAIVKEVAAAVGLDATGARRLKFTNNAVIALPASRAVLRIPGSPVARARVLAVLAAATWFADHDLPTVRLWPDLTQPLHVGADPVTVWRQITPGGPAPTPGDLAAVLHGIHALDQPPPELPAWSVTDGIGRRLATATGLDPDTHAFLAGQLTDLRARLAALADLPPLIPPGVIHGDAHLGNLIASPTGPALCDFDSTSVGPREWDLTPAAVGALRFDYRPDVHAGLVDAYGVDVTTWAGFATLRRLRELQLVTSVLPVLDTNPALRPQWRHRLNTFRDNDYHTPWTPYADLGA
jgi:hypothetical protein